MKTLIALAAGLLAAAGAQAHIEVFTATLSGANENPVNASAGTGFATVTMDLDLATMRVQATFSGLTGNVTASHIHCCSTPPANASVATQTPTFTGFPLGGKLGTYDHTFDLTQKTTYNTTPGAFFDLNGGTVSGAMNALILGMEAGKSYLNIHTSTFQGGEIRGILQLSPVPEPETYAMLALGLGVVGAVARRRRA